LALVLLFLAYTQLFRYLGPFQSGQYQFILSYVLIFSTVIDFGIQQFITKSISERPDDAKKYFQQFFSFEIIAALLLYAVLIILAQVRHYDAPVFYGVALAGLGMVANALTYPYLSVMAAFQDMRKVALVNFLNSVVNMAVIFSAIVFHKNIVFLASVQLLFGILDLFLYRFFVRKHIPNPEVLKGIMAFDWDSIKNIIKQAWPFALLVGFSAIYNRIDVVLITWLKGYQDTGYYTAAYKVFDLLGFFPSVVSYTLFPFFTSLMARKAIGEVRENLEKYVRLMVAFALPMAVGGSILSVKLISLVAGKEYAPAAPILSILIWAPAILFIYIPVNSLVISQLTKKALLITGINVLVNVAGNVLLIPHFGIRAAAVMTVFSESLQCIFYFHFVQSSITKFSIFKYTWQPAVASLIMGVVLFPLRSHNLVLSLVVGALVYGLGLVVTGFLKKDDLQTIKQLFSSKQSVAVNLNS
jgi:O-antigen/teichoic acid export membrane protein